MRFIVLFSFLIGCTYESYQYPYEDCEYDDCPLSYSGGELCCDDYTYECWYRADGIDFQDISSYVDYCYGY